MDNISKIGANANFYIQSQSLKKEEDTKKTQVKQNGLQLWSGIFIALVFLLLASNLIKKKGKIDVKHMPKSVAGTSNVVDRKSVV